MPFSPELKAKVIYFVGRNVFERIKPDLQLEQREDATLESAKRADQETGNFRESAQLYFSVYQSQGVGIKAEALIGLSQELINLGVFRQARRLLEKEPPLILPLLDERYRVVFQARVEEKKGWIEDYELGYSQAKECFYQAGEIITQLPRDQWTSSEEELYSTTRHFLGRAEYGLAYLGVDRSRNIRQAIGHFQDGIVLDAQIESAHREAKTGFGYGWLLKCYLLVQDMPKAREALEQARYHFTKQLEQTPRRKGSLAHLRLLEGAIDLAEGRVQRARERFEEAVRIRKEDEPYGKGLADAYLGMSAVSWKEGKRIAAAGYFARALKTHPYIVFKASFGG